MPVTKAKNRFYPVNGLTTATPQMNGLYVHSSPPKVLQANSKTIRQWIRSGDLNQLEQMVLEGQGHKLIGEYSPDSKIRNFIKQVPSYMLKINELHKAVTKGNVKMLQKLLDSKVSDTFYRKIFMNKNNSGVGLLHKATYYGYPDIVQFLVSNFPQCLNMKDKEGKTALHYCGASQKAGKIWPILIKAGANSNIADFKNRLPSYYMERPNEIHLAEDKTLPEMSNSVSDIIIKPSNIRIWIHDRDLEKLRRVIWEGHGGKLRVETSNNHKVKKFLEGIPLVLNAIKEAHSHVINGETENFVKKTSDPIPMEILGSKDVNGLNPLHKAAGLGRLKIARYILEKNAKLVSSTDQEGKTPLHYAAILKDDNAMFNLLLGKGADEMILDKYNKSPSYYKNNAKEINVKNLEVIPEAPRTSLAASQNWDWMMFNPGGSTASTVASISRENLSLRKNNDQKVIDKPNDMSDEIKFQNNEIQENEFQENSNAEKEEDNYVETEDNSQSVNMNDEKNLVENVTEKNIENNIDNLENTYDIWTNDEHFYQGKPEKKEELSENVEITENESHDNEENSYDGNDIISPNYVDYNDNTKIDEKNFIENAEILKNVENVEDRERTEREIAEERQRLLDEGLLKINNDHEETQDESKKFKELIENGDIEKLASMVLNGEGDKLMGQTSNNPEIQTFLNNLPSYMAKITAVHRAAKNGSLKDLQGALDRRRFAIAKESSENLGATPLHVAILFGNSQITKYLGGRFPETLKAKDKFGRTPLHYAAVLKDDNYFFNTLLNLGADQNITDDAGHTAEYYRENEGELTKEELLKGFDSKEISSPVTDPSVHNMEPEISFDEGLPLSKIKENEETEEENDSNFNVTDRDEYGQSILHFAAARAHGRGGLFQLIHESSVNLGYRDELYRTARDVAVQANIPENVNEVDKYVISLVARDEREKLIHLFLEGYDHILDLEDDENNDILSVASKKSYDKTLAFLKGIPFFEEKREEIHRAIRAGDEKLAQDMITNAKNGRFMVVGKNTTGRCSLHISVLCQQIEITEFIAQKFPETLKIGDNLERTALHYAMGVDKVETLSKILIKCGAKRVVKDLKGRQPTYYFMNKTEITKLQEEENILKDQLLQ